MPPTPNKLTIHPPRPASISEPAQPVPTTSTQDANTAAQNAATTSPVAPAFSPITPKVQPAFPAAYPLPTQDAPFGAFSSLDANIQPSQHDSAVASNANYIPPPPPRPFSSEDSTDAIALRAAISSLQFQKKKAAEDIRALEGLRKKALDEPELFKTELAAGRLKEEKPKIGDLRAILDEDDSEDEEEEEEVEPSTTPEAGGDDTPPFDRIPGPQNIVRMPYINWEKYHIHGEALDRMHEQQRKWPGSFDYGQEKGREFAVAAPYSPWQDSVDGQSEYRKDSLAASTTGGVATPTSVSEHPMETRRSVQKGQ